MGIRSAGTSFRANWGTTGLGNKGGNASIMAQYV